MKAPFLQRDVIIHQADVFNHTHNPTYDCPVLIEEIIETKLSIKIFPVKDLEKARSIDGTISQDFSTIIIDEYVYESQVDRARFTMAHEIGHFVLHKELFEADRVKLSLENFADYMNKLSFKDWGLLETQASIFAQEVLMPNDIFLQEIGGEIDKFGGPDKLIISDLQIIIDKIREIFRVSHLAAWQKLKHEFPLVEKIAHI